MAVEVVEGGVADGLAPPARQCGSAGLLVLAFLMDLTSASMIVFAITGVYLWFQLEKRRLPGALILAAGFVYTASMVIYLLQ
ncbi:MAG: hypothetical protein SFV54_20400 [Bryobacteraceae bacterium]|nr:hypothetical protein [Bryobacteraceae bacterium]